MTITETDLLQQAEGVVRDAFKIARRIARDAAHDAECEGYDRALAGALTTSIVQLYIHFTTDQ
jgi:hypothetical protein